MPHGQRQQIVALVTDNANPDLSASDQQLVAPLHELGLEAVAVPWETPDASWQAFDLVVLRACWNYHRRHAAFSDWIDRLEAVGARVWNPPPVVRWNMDKQYLRELAVAGTPVVPTVWLNQGQSARLADILDAQGWRHVVVKPRVGASAHGIRRVERSGASEQQGQLDAMLAAGGALIQPLMPQIAAGEWSFVFFDGSFSHAALKVPTAGGIFVQRRLGGSSSVRRPDAVLIEQAALALGAATRQTQPAGERLLYARVDGLVVEGRLVLMELVLIEPGLFLDQAPPAAAAQFAAAIAGRVRC